MSPRTLGILAALGSSASWALGAVLFKKLGDELSSPSMTLVKSLISAVLLGMVLLVLGFQSIPRSALLLLIFSGVLGIAVGDTLFFASLKELSAHTLIMLFTGGQILTVLLAVVFLGEVPSPRTWVGIGLVAAGIMIVLRANVSGDQPASHWKGILFGVLSVTCMSVSLIIAKKPLNDISAMQATFIRMLAGGVAMLALSSFNWQAGAWLQPFKNTKLLGRFFVSVCVITFGGFWLSLAALKNLDVAVANTLNSAEPLFILPIGALFLREKVTLRAVAGSVVAVAGIALICLS